MKGGERTFKLCVVTVKKFKYICSSDRYYKFYDLFLLFKWYFNWNIGTLKTIVTGKKHLTFLETVKQGFYGTLHYANS